MKPTTCVRSLLALAVVLLLAGPSWAVFPKPDYYEYYSLYQGWYNGGQAWFTSTTTNNIAFARSPNWGDFWSPWFPSCLDLSSKLSLALDTDPKVARPVYIVTNLQQGPVFSAAPGQSPPDMLYSALWQVFFVQWKQDAFRQGLVRPITSVADLPSPSLADILETGVVVDMPILALGPLGGPWTPTSPGVYRTKQVREYDPSAAPKWVMLPHFSVFADWPLTMKPCVAEVSITDVADEVAAALLGANLAPGLAAMPTDGRQSFWVMNNPKPPRQLPLVDAVPSFCATSFNGAYTPVLNLTPLNRNIPPYATVSTQRFLKLLLAGGGLIPSGPPVAVNGHMMQWTTESHSLSLTD